MPTEALVSIKRRFRTLPDKKGLLDTAQEGRCEKRSNKQQGYKHESNSLLERHFKIPRSAGQGLPLELAKEEETTDSSLAFATSTIALVDSCPKSLNGMLGVDSKALAF